MDPMISEFSYGYALTEELALGRLGRLRGAPLFPSLIEEGRAGGGYDVQLPRIGIPLFLQFKLSHYMRTRGAAERRLFMSPYYRMYLRPLRHSRQHFLLQQLEGRGNEVYYAAPEFYLLDELNDAYLNNRVLERSAFFRPLDINLPDDKSHYVVFNKSSPAVWRCSREPFAVPKTSGHDLMASLIDKTEANGQEIDEPLFLSTAQQLKGILLESGMKVTVNENLSAKRIVGYLARAYFEAEVFIVGAEER